MGNTSAQDQEQALQGGCHGRGSLPMRKPSLLFHLPSLMGLNGSNCNTSLSTILFFTVLSL
jgi:hypothetical protein